MGVRSISFAPVKKLRPLWRSNKIFRVAWGGRGSSKSYDFAQRFVALGLAEKCRLLCTREVQNSLADSSLAIMKRVILDHGLAACFRQTKYGLAAMNGSEYIFRGLQFPDRITSLDGIKYCWVEEAKSVTQTAFDFLIPTIRGTTSDDKVEIWISFNAENETDPVYQMFIANKHEDADVVKVNYYDNPYFPDVLRKLMEWDKAHDYEKYLWVWEGNCRAISDALIFKGKFVEQYFETPKDVAFLFGGDYGFAQDPAVLLRCFIKDNNLYIDYEAYDVGIEIDHLPAFYDRIPESRKWLIDADSERPDTISYLRRHGFNIRGVEKGPNSVEEGIEFLRTFNKIIVHPRCVRTLEEFKLYKFKVDKLTNQIMPTPVDKHNHCMDSLRYAVRRLRHAIPRVRTL